MPQFSERSKVHLREAHADLQALFEKVVETYDCAVLCGFRNKEDQDAAFSMGESKKKWPDSPHNQSPSLAVDVVPVPVDWKNTKRFYHFAGFVIGIAKSMGIKIRWGGDWNCNTNLDDQSFFDLPHFELIK